MLQQFATVLRGIMPLILQTTKFGNAANGEIISNDDKQKTDDKNYLPSLSL
jgi:hypothetical protein